MSDSDKDWGFSLQHPDNAPRASGRANEGRQAVNDDRTGVNPMSEDMRCGLPDCGATLYMEWHFSMAIPDDATKALLADPKNHHASSWQVVCSNGHTVLLPVNDTGDDNWFGECRCEPTDPYEGRWCGHGDFGRLARIASPPVASSPVGGEQ